MGFFIFLNNFSARILNKIISNKKIIDLLGSLKNELILTPINDSDTIIISFDGIKANKNTVVFKLANADAPLIKKEGVNGKQYKKNSTVKFFFLIFSRVPEYLLFLIFFSSLFPPTFLIKKNSMNEPRQLPIHE